jgi:AraC-like DNA-binding protein
MSSDRQSFERVVVHSKPVPDRVVLAGVSSEYREITVAGPLADHFYCMWVHCLKPKQVGQITVVPDGCVDIVWVDGRMEIIGPHIGAHLVPITQSRNVVGMRFRPGAATQWLRAPMSELVGRRVDAREFFGFSAQDIAQRVSNAQSMALRGKVLARSLSRFALELPAAPAEMTFIFDALQNCSTGKGLSIVLERLSISPRTLRRRCETAFGYGPKTLDRILRFRRFMNLARQEGATLAELALEAGYADQPHLTREARRLSNLQPTSVMAQLRG